VDLRAAEEMMTGRRESIRRIFLGDQLTPEGPAVTATEAVIRQAEKMRVLGPVLGRLQTEFLGPLIRRVFRIMLRSGELPPFPQDLSPRDLEVRYTSPVSRAQKQYEAQGLAQVMEYLSPLVGSGDPFGIMDNFDTDRVARHVAELFNTPSDYLKSEDGVAEGRARKQQDSGQARTVSTLANAAAIAKTLSEAYTDRPSALTELWGLLTGAATAGIASAPVEPESPAGPESPAAPPEPSLTEEEAPHA
jgi:hypothetical protein